MSTQTSPLPQASPAAPRPRGRRLAVLVLAALLLVSACSDDPSAPAAGPSPDSTPELPVAPVSDAAAWLPGAGSGVEFTELPVPHRLVLPSGTVVVEASAQVPELTTGMVSALIGRESNADTDRFVPADGQRVHLWRVVIDAPPAMAPPLSMFSGSGPVQDPSARVALHAGGGPVHLTSGNGERDIALDCPAVPCGGGDDSPRVLVASLDASAEPTLVAMVADHELTLDLTSGEVTSDVSAVAQNRPDTAYTASIDWPLSRYLVRTEEQVEADAGTTLVGDAEVIYRGRLDEMYLAPFDQARGWAPAGSAWAVLPVEDAFTRTHDGWSAELDHASSWTLTYDDETASPAEPTDIPGQPVFLVPDDITAATLTYRPAGTVSADFPPAEYTFQVDEPLVAELTFE